MQAPTHSVNVDSLNLRQGFYLVDTGSSSCTQLSELVKILQFFFKKDEAPGSNSWIIPGLSLSG